MLARLGLGEVRATAETALYNGGSAWAEYWRQTVTELRPRLVASGQLDDRSIDTFLARCAEPAWWTQTIAFTAVGGALPRLNEAPVFPRGGGVHDRGRARRRAAPGPRRAGGGLRLAGRRLR